MINILCRDNSKTIRQVIMDCVLDLNYGFYEADNGISGIEDAGTIENLALIILDWNMPDMSGKETLRNLRSIEKFNNSLILVLIRIENKDDVVEAIDIGANNYMLKPFNVNKLQDKIQEMIKNAG